MDARKIIRSVARLLLLDTIFEFVYWIAVLVGLLKLGSLFENTVVLVIVIAAYAVGATALYYFVVRKLKWN